MIEIGEMVQERYKSLNMLYENLELTEDILTALIVAKVLESDSRIDETKTNQETLNEKIIVSARNIITTTKNEVLETLELLENLD